MKKYFCSFLVFLFSLLMLAPANVLAHGHTVFEINGKVYSFTIGSLNEPVAVDDKTGLDLRVANMAGHLEDDHTTTPVVGLDKTLKVELIASGKKKILDISPVYNTPGAYKANFIPTVQTTFSYRLFGAIDSIPFDYTWTCNPAGHPQAAEDKSEVRVSEGVLRIEAAGAFGCPTAKADLGFPESAVTNNELNSKVNAAAAESGSGSKGLAIAALALAAVSLAASGRGFFRGQKNP